MTMNITPYSDENSDDIIELITTIQIEEFGVATSAERQPDLRDIPGFISRVAGISGLHALTENWQAPSPSRIRVTTSAHCGKCS